MPDFDLDAALCSTADWPAALAAARKNADTSCFCPGGGGDWKPLLKLCHLCDTFLFADLRIENREATASLRDSFERFVTEHGEPHELRFSDARSLWLGTEFCDMEAAMVEFLEAHYPASATTYRRAVLPLARQDRNGVEAILRHGVGEDARNIRVLVCQAEALACYHGVFAARQVAPQVVLLPRQTGRRTIRSRHLLLSGPLGAVMREEPRPQVLVAAQEDSAALAGTPWPHRWCQLRECDLAAFTTWPVPAHLWFEALQTQF